MPSSAPSPEIFPPGSSEPRLFLARGYRVILDADLAAMYGVKTKQFNQAIKRNQSRFPEDFAFQWTGEEARHLRSQTVTSSLNVNLVSLISDAERGGRRTLPWVFTEHGAVMAANLLKSEQAVRLSVFVVRAFIKMREQIAANADILKHLAEIDKSLLEHDSMLLEIYDKILPLLAPDEPEPPLGRKMGFHRGP